MKTKIRVRCIILCLMGVMLIGLNVRAADVTPEFTQPTTTDFNIFDFNAGIEVSWKPTTENYKVYVQNQDSGGYLIKEYKTKLNKVTVKGNNLGKYRVKVASIQNGKEYWNSFAINVSKDYPEIENIQDILCKSSRSGLWEAYDYPNNHYMKEVNHITDYCDKVIYVTSEDVQMLAKLKMGEYLKKVATVKQKPDAVVNTLVKMGDRAIGLYYAYYGTGRNTAESQQAVLELANKLCAYNNKEAIKNNIGFKTYHYYSDDADSGWLQTVSWSSGNVTNVILHKGKFWAYK